MNGQAHAESDLGLDLNLLLTEIWVDTNSKILFYKTTNKVYESECRSSNDYQVPTQIENKGNIMKSQYLLHSLMCVTYL